ncbi:MAG: hypothetical protein HQL56_07450 [Magnetococcales bacterium]|nr:hypothetical protein [Magnetococcales bacterium]
MKQWGMNTMMKRMTLLSLAGAVTVAMAGCGGGGSSSSSSTISGTAVKGPLKSAAISYKGSSTGSSTSTTGTYSLAISTPSVAEELTFSASGATDNFTGTTPSFDLSTIVTSTSAASGVVNANPLTTILAAGLKAAAGGTLSGLTSSTLTSNYNAVKTGVLSSFGLGAGDISGFDPVTSNVRALSSTNAAKLSMAMELLAESIRDAVDASTSSGTNKTASQIISALGDELKDGSMNYNITTSGAQQLVLAVQAAVAMNVANLLQGTLTFANSKTLTDLNSAFSGVFTSSGTSLDTVNAAFAAASSDFLQVAKTNMVAYAATLSGTAATDWNNLANAVDLMKTTKSTSTWSSAAAALTTPISSLATATALKTVTSLSDSAAAAAASSAATAVAAATSFKVTKSSIYVVDGDGSTKTPTSATVSSSVLTANLNSSNTLSASNLSSLAATSPSGTVPRIVFTLTSMPVGTGTATVTMLLKDGTSATRSTGQRYIQVSYDVNWSSTGSELTLTLPASGSATVTYYKKGDSSASTTTVSNKDADNLLVTSTSTNQSAGATSIKGAIGTLMSHATLGASLDATAAAGDYFYQFGFSGFNLIDDANSSFTTIQGTFTAK